jgi:hypothetical protein
MISTTWGLDSVLKKPGVADRLNNFAATRRGRNRISRVIADMAYIHEELSSVGTGDSPMIQAASQANFLEMPNPHTTPDAGVGQYEFDDTQGPACAIEAYPGLLLRSHFILIPDGTFGQRADPQRQGDGQINGFRDLFKSTITIDPAVTECTRPADFTADKFAFADFFGNAPLNGYPWPKDDAGAGSRKLAHLAYAVCNASKSRRRQQAWNELFAKAGTVGVMVDTQVVGRPHNTDDIYRQKRFVSQVYVSALPLTYWAGAGYGTEVPHIEDLAKLILTAQYYTTFLSALVNLDKALQKKTSPNDIKNAHKVYLTLVGGGAFGNEMYVCMYVCNAWYVCMH